MSELQSSEDLVNDILKDDVPVDDKSDKSDKSDKADKIEIKDNEEVDDDKIELEDDDKKKDKKETKKKDESDEDDDDDELESDELEDKELEIEAPPRKKDITAKYPNFFKEFGWMEKMMYRDKQYTELFGSFDDAKEYHAKAQALDAFEEDLGSGNTEKILNSVKKANPKAYDKLIDNYLPILAKVDKEAYIEVTGNIAKHIIREMATEGQSSNDDELQKAALLLNKFLFGTNKYTAPKSRVSEDSKKDDELDSERQSFIRERFEASRDDLQTRVDNTLKNTISEYIDPRGEMSAYIKKNAVRDALQALHSNIAEDKAFRKTLDKLWESAFAAKFSKNSLDRIRSAYLGRSKGTLPVIIRKARAEALKDAKPASRIVKDDDEEAERSERKPRTREAVTPGPPRRQSGNMKMEKGESVLDFLSRD